MNISTVFNAYRAAKQQHVSYIEAYVASPVATPLRGVDRDKVARMMGRRGRQRWRFEVWLERKLGCVNSSCSPPSWVYDLYPRREWP